MKAFKVLTLLSLAAALSCGANGSPTGITTDSFIKRQSAEELQKFLKDESLGSIIRAAWDAADEDNTKFIKEFLNKLADSNKHYNYVVYRVPGDFKFNGKEEEDWAHKTITAGDSSYNYDLVVGGSGTFTRKDASGGHANWGWRGTVPHNQDLQGTFVTFLKPGSHSGAFETGGNI